MLKQEIKITVVDIDDKLIQFSLKVTNGINSISNELYAYADEFKNFGNGLIAFPKSIEDVVKYEHGKIDKRVDCYILLRAFCYERNGHCAIHIKIENNGVEPYTSRGEFYIMTVPASLNELGQLLFNWNPETREEIIWTAGWVS
jgi:hypothetical protein